MGQPKAGQLIGTPRENLTELAGRICYDSLGQGRPSAGYHEHIQDVGHLSVYEHAYVTADLMEFDSDALYKVFCNRRGTYYNDGVATINLRALLEWSEYSRFSQLDQAAEYNLRHAFSRVMPMVVPEPEIRDFKLTYRILNESDNPKRNFLSFWLYGSRGFSHEMVRHRFNISQRSTRYVDECPDEFDLNDPLVQEIKANGEYVYHPLLLKYLEDESVPLDEREEIAFAVKQARFHDRLAYSCIVNALQEYTEGNRKQSRGAARGVLANALATELIYTASVHDWRKIFKARVSDPADAEIRVVLAEAAVQAGYEVVPASDGLGYILK
jgi:thymidylate synthase ThyX